MFEVDGVSRGIAEEAFRRASAKFRVRTKVVARFGEGGVAMNGVEVRLKTDDELKAMLLALKKEAFNLRFQRASGQLENTARMRAVKRDVARVKTIATERRQAAGKG